MQQSFSHSNADAPIIRRTYNNCMEKRRDPEKLREALKRFMDSRKLNVNSWAKASGVSPGSLYNFFRGDSDDLTHGTLAALAESQGVTIAAITGAAEDQPLRMLREIPARGGLVPMNPNVLRTILVEALGAFENADDPEEVADAILSEYRERTLPPTDPGAAFRAKMRERRKASSNS